MKKIETSKLILIVSYTAAIILTIIVVYGAFANIDMTNVQPICLASWGEVAATNIFYYRKAGRENSLKIAKSLPEEWKQQIDINQLINHE